MKHDGKVVCIVNPKAGAKKGLDRSTLAECPLALEVWETSATASPQTLAERAAKDAQVAMVIAGGGDGTINSVAQALAESDKPLAALPLGTFNHFAKDLEMPLEIPAALAALGGGHIDRIDVGEVNGHLFLNNSSIGMYPLMVFEREFERRRGSSKWWAMAKAAARIFLRYPAMTVTLQVEGKTVTRRAPLFFVANNKYEAKGLTLGRRERLDSGKLYLYIPHNIGRMHLLKLSLDFLSGRIHEAEGIDVLEVESFTVHARRKKIPVAMDGEVKILSVPLEYRSRPRALAVVRPAVKKEEAA